MKPIATLFDHAPTAGGKNLSEPLHSRYGGDLHFPVPTAHPVYVAVNFVSTLDGIVSYQIPGKSGGGEISGFNEEDQFIMGLLRNLADAILFGSGTLHGDPGHVRTPEFVYPPLRDAFRTFRQSLKKPLYPLNVVITGSGNVDLNEPTFHTPGLSTLVITTEAGYSRLRRDHGDALSTTQVRTVGNTENKIAPAEILKILRSDFGVEHVVLEGGPTLFGEFLADGQVDELFLTLAPQIAGQSASDPRPGIVAHTVFSPASAPWFDLLSLKKSENHFFARYRRR